MSNEHWSNEMRRRFPDGAWFRARGWQETALYRRNPATVDRAMEALSMLIEPSWFVNEVTNPTRAMHPICLSIFDVSYICFWSAFKVGYDLDAVGSIPATLRARLLHPGEIRGAMMELSAAAALARHGVAYDWFPEEGGEFRISDALVRYVEVKRPMYESGRTRNEIQSLQETSRRLSEALSQYVTSFSLHPDLCDDARKRAKLDWNAIAETMITAARAMVAENDVPARREHDFGYLWVARTKAEMSELGAGGFSGFYLDNQFEAQHIIHGAMRRAIQQLPADASSLIYIDGAATTGEFFRAVHRRLSKLSSKDPQIVGVLVRKSGFTNEDIVPAFATQLIENPNLPGIAARSRVTHALAADDSAPLRDPAARPTLEF